MATSRPSRRRHVQVMVTETDTLKLADGDKWNTSVDCKLDKENTYVCYCSSS